MCCVELVGHVLCSEPIQRWRPSAATTEGSGLRPPPSVVSLVLALNKAHVPALNTAHDVLALNKAHVLRLIWGRLWVPLEPLGLPWGAFGSSCGCRGSVWAALGGHAAETQCLCTKYCLLEPIPESAESPESPEVVSRSAVQTSLSTRARWSG